MTSTKSYINLLLTILSMDSLNICFVTVDSLTSTCHYETKICEKSMKGQKSLKNQWNFIDFSVIFHWFLIFHRFLSPSVLCFWIQISETRSHAEIDLSNLSSQFIYSLFWSSWLNWTVSYEKKMNSRSWKTRVSFAVTTLTSWQLFQILILIWKKK